MVTPALTPSLTPLGEGETFAAAGIGNSLRESFHWVNHEGGMDLCSFVCIRGCSPRVVRVPPALRWNSTGKVYP